MWEPPLTLADVGLLAGPSTWANSKISEIVIGGNMGALRKPVWTLAMVLVTLSISQAKTNYAYVANYSANTVSVINTSNNTVLTPIAVGTNPWGVAVNEIGSFAYVTNSGSSSVSPRRRRRRVARTNRKSDARCQRISRTHAPI